MLKIWFVLIFALSFLKKILPPAALTPVLKKYLYVAQVGAGLLLAGYFVFQQGNWIFLWLTYGITGTLIGLIFTLKEWRMARYIAIAILPITAALLAGDLTSAAFPGFYSEYRNYFDTAFLFGLIWAVALLLIYRNQNKALQSEKLKLEEKEREIQASEKVKLMLEEQVKERTAELTRQKEELQHALNELKAAQEQLIHNEKMASLGELTAGIAHEIQNPLNFVNNFSELNAELINELKGERLKREGERDEELVNELLNDISENEKKISLHGKRADAIVKGMLQHSRTSSGQKEPTDINALADEYLRLSFHGLRAKNKSFHARFSTRLDDSIGLINVVPQDIGRLLLNLINNAFYAVTEKEKQVGGNFEPAVEVSTRKENNKVLVTVRDNGNGIPDSIRDKIFQPFFTTKPTGQGTGLGLSLSFDIARAHGGELKLETRPGEGSQFTLVLPVGK